MPFSLVYHNKIQYLNKSLFIIIMMIFIQQVFKFGSNINHMAKKYLDSKGQLQKIYQSSSPETTNKGASSPLRNCRNRVLMGGFAQTYKSFFKLQSQIQSKPSNGASNKISSTQSIAQKDKTIQQLQQKIMRETIKKNARELSYGQRLSKNWKQQIQFLIIQFIKITLKLAKRNKDIKKSVLNVLFNCSKKDTQRDKMKIIMHWIASWLKPIFAMISWICQKNIS